MISLRSDKSTLIALALAAPVLFFLMWVGLHWILAVILFVAFAFLIRGTMQKARRGPGGDRGFSP
jgi:hypothetical protein